MIRLKYGSNGIDVFFYISIVFEQKDQNRNLAFLLDDPMLHAQLGVSPPTRTAFAQYIFISPLAIKKSE